MEWKLELVAVPVTDVDRAKAFYTTDLAWMKIPTRCCTCSAILGLTVPLFRLNRRRLWDFTCSHMMTDGFVSPPSPTSTRTC